jgi:lysophospholipase L1-like esterase
MGIPSHSDGYFGSTLGTGGRDSRLGLGAGWSTASSIATLAGLAIRNATTTNPLTFTPTGPVDTFEIWWLGGSVAGTFTWSIDGGSTTSVDATAGGLQFGRTIASAASAGIHTLSLARLSGAAFIAGIDAYDSTQRRVSQVVAGQSAATIANLTNGDSTSSPLYPLNAVTTYAPDLTILNEGINDAIQATVITAYSASMQLMISKALQSGDVILMVPHPVSTSSASAAVQAAIRDAIYALAAANGGLPVVDLTERFVDYASASAAGWMSDSWHCNAAGYWDEAQAIARVLAA